jgi:hypothetical protein
MTGRESQRAAIIEPIESSIEEINNAAVLASELGNSEIAVWLEWLSEELDELLINIIEGAEDLSVLQEGE